MRTLLAVALAATTLPGCGGAPALDPPEIRLNQDTCHACGMIISDARHAAAVVVLHGGVAEKYVFDDTGEMLEFRLDGGATDVRRYVHDYSTGRWIDAPDAHFVQARALRTPMGTGVVAYGTAEAARTAAVRHEGRVWPDALKPLAATHP